MTESSPAIYRRVCRRERARPGGTLDPPRTNEFHPSLRDGQLPFGNDPAMNRRATFRCPSGTSILSQSDFRRGFLKIGKAWSLRAIAGYSGSPGKNSFRRDPRRFLGQPLTRMLHQALILTSHREYAQAMRQGLLKLGHEKTRIDVEVDAVRAMQLAPQQYELILLDTVMDTMDGLQLLQLIKQQSPASKFILVSDSADKRRGPWLTRMAPTFPGTSAYARSFRAGAGGDPGSFQAERRRRTSSQ